MRKFHSSTSSSEPRSALGPPPHGTIAAALLAIAICGAAELVARSALRPMKPSLDYWNADAGQKFEYFLGLVHMGKAPGLVVVGDSTAARNLNPTILAAELHVSRGGFGLAWPANFPMALECTTLPLLRSGALAPSILVYSASPASFIGTPDVTRFEESILSSPICRQRLGNATLVSHLDLPRILAVWDHRGYWWTGKGLRQAPPLSGFMPLPVKSGEVEPLKSNTSGWEQVPVELDLKRLGMLWQLAREARGHGSLLVIVVPPIALQSPRIKALAVSYRKMLEYHREELGYEYLSYGEEDLPQASDFSGGYHLNRQGADRFSLRVASDIGNRLRNRAASGARVSQLH